MSIRNCFLLITAILLSFLLFGCGGAEDGDLTPPNFTIDSSVPVITADPGTDVSPYVFFGTTDPDAEVEVSVSFPTTDPVPTLTTPTVQSDGSWSFELYGLVEGSNTIAIDVADPLGNSTVYFVTILLDLTGPVVTIDQYDSPTAPKVVSIAGTVSELGSTVDIDVVDSTSTSVITPITNIPTTLGNSVWSTDIDLSFLDGGTYTVEATGYDIYGNPSATVATQEITVSLTSPELTVSTPASFPEIIADPSNVSTVSFSGTKEIGCDMSISTGSGLVANLVLATDTDVWSFDLTEIASGNTIVTLTVSGGTCSESSTSRNMVVRDLLAPFVADIQPRSAEQVTAGLSIPIKVVFGENMDSLTVVENQTVLLEDVTIDDDVETLIPLTYVADDGVTFDFTADLPTAGKFKVRVLNDDVTPLTILDARSNAATGEAASTFVVVP